MPDPVRPPSDRQLLSASLHRVESNLLDLYRDLMGNKLVTAEILGFVIRQNIDLVQALRIELVDRP